MVDPPWRQLPCLEADADGAEQADRIDAGMRAEAAVLDRDDRVAHHRRDPLIGDPFAEARAHGVDDLAVGGADADHLAEIAAADELGIRGQLADRDRDGDGERDQRRSRSDRRTP